MLYKELKEKQCIILKEDINLKYTLYKLNKEELDIIQNNLSLNENNELELELQLNNKNNYCDFFNMIYMGGHIDEFKINDCKHVIPIYKKHVIKNSRTLTLIDYQFIIEYKCYQEHKIKSINTNVIIHEDTLSSLKCACEKLQTKYFIILKEELNNYKKI